jgi:hypothetical protein
MTIFFVVMVGLLVLVAWIWAVVTAIEWTEYKDAWPNGLVPVFVIVVPIAAVVAIGVHLAAQDTESPLLCLKGHQQWTQQDDSRVKVWVCDVWEAER